MNQNDLTNARPNPSVGGGNSLDQKNLAGVAFASNLPDNNGKRTFSPDVVMRVKGIEPKFRPEPSDSARVQRPLERRRLKPRPGNDQINWQTLGSVSYPQQYLWWVLANSAVFVLLFLQTQVFYVEELAQVPTLKPYVGSFCKLIRCPAPVRRDVYQIELQRTRVTTHADTPGALRITVNLINRAEFPQPYPAVQLTLTDKGGRVVGRRAYPPEHYLGLDANTRRLLPQASNSIVLDLAQAHEQAVGFDVIFVNHI